MVRCQGLVAVSIATVILATSFLAVPGSAQGGYTWTLDCNGDGFATASWNWTAGGQSIPGAGGTAICFQTTVTGSGERPANADGFVAYLVDTVCDYWQYGFVFLHGTCADGAHANDTFDPANSYKMSIGVHFSGSWETCSYPGFAGSFSPDGKICYKLHLSGGAHFKVDS